MPKKYCDTWSSSAKQDPSKGFYYLKYVLDTLNEANIRGKVACLLPVACAIGGRSKIIKKFKKDVLEKNTLDAVFTLPAEVFYPGASATVCCMVFLTGVRHKDSGDTFFGYYKEDGFKKRKNLGRVEQKDSKSNESLWSNIEKEWLDLYRNRTSKPGISSIKKVSELDEWLCENYMETDYGRLSINNFIKCRNDFLSYLVIRNKWKLINEFTSNDVNKINLDYSDWKKFNVGKLFKCKTTKNSVREEFESGTIPYVTRSALNNGVDDFVDAQKEKITPGKCITIGAEGIYSFYQIDDFATGVKVYQLRNDEMNMYNALFLCTILNLEDYRYSYGRARILDKVKLENIYLPIKMNKKQKPIIDPNKKYSEEGYIPDFEFMEKYIKSLPFED